MNTRNLYFVAIIPPDEIAAEITSFKIEAKEKFNSGHALKSPPHITLITPFWLDDSALDSLKLKLQVFSESQTPFDLELNGFDFFAPRVIFISNEESRHLNAFQREMYKFCKCFHKIEERGVKAFHPHMTIAFKDLKKSNFDEAREYFSQISFDRSFKVDKFYLLRHKSGKWVLNETFKLS